eukprot:gene16100-biopygen9765
MAPWWHPKEVANSETLVSFYGWWTPQLQALPAPQSSLLPPLPARSIPTGHRFGSPGLAYAPPTDPPGWGAVFKHLWNWWGPRTGAVSHVGHPRWQL